MTGKDKFLQQQRFNNVLEFLLESSRQEKHDFLEEITDMMAKLNNKREIDNQSQLLTELIEEVEKSEVVFNELTQSDLLYKDDVIQLLKSKLGE